ncbi:MAG: isoprenylcysteine carboxylmethyltransferase family protein [Caulobacter sp.]|nr:isoprenylcysteine carboxylmethyltransferase family protein [Caulobacter sp.]
MGRVLAAVYGVVCYFGFFAAFLYLIAFVGDFAVPTTLEKGPAASLMTAVLIDVGLLVAFAVQHSLMARPAFKRLWTKVVPEPIERSTYVLFTTAVLILIFWQWRPIPAPIWTVTNTLAVTTIQGLFWLGWGVVLLSTFLLNHFELFGLRQVWLNFKQQAPAESTFRTPFLYRLVRHPIYLGFLIALWATPVMSLGHLLFAAGLTLYIVIGVQFEERDLIDHFGETYQAYRRKVSMLIPWPPKAS